MSVATSDPSTPAPLPPPPPHRVRQGITAEITGRLTADPDIGARRTTFTVAANVPYRTGDPDRPYAEHTTFVRVVAFAAAHAAFTAGQFASLRKGTLVRVREAPLALQDSTGAHGERLANLEAKCFHAEHITICAQPRGHGSAPPPAPPEGA